VGLWEHFDPLRLVRRAEEPPDFYGAIVRSRRLADICGARPYRVAALAFVQIDLAQIGNVLRASEILAKGNWDIGALDRAGIELPLPMRCDGSSIVAFHCPIHPTVRAMAKRKARLLGMPVMLKSFPSQSFDRFALLVDFGLDETGEVSQRILPAEIARFLRNDVRNTFLHDVHLGANRYPPERDRHLDFTRQVGIVEFVRVAQALAGHELQIFSAERMAHARGEISE
jgi:hypothetical protein